MSRKKIKGQKVSANDLRYHIRLLLKRDPSKRLNAKQIRNKLKVLNNTQSINDALERLEKDNYITHVKEGKYKHLKNYQRRTKEKAEANGEATAPSEHSKKKRRDKPTKKKRSGGRDYPTHTGFVDMTRTGSAYIVCEGLEDDVYVSKGDLNGALNGDKVQVALTGGGRNRKLRGEVVEVLERSTVHFIGTLHKSRKYAFVVADKMNMPVDILVYPENTMDAEDLDKVVVKVKKWHDSHNRSPIGEVTEVLGSVGSSDMAMKAILINNGFELGFWEEVTAEADAIPVEITDEDREGRRDFRDVLTFTIDPLTAKDFDDAISYRRKENGNLEVGIHIADVSHYVQPGSMLDKQAAERSTSVYLVDRVLPMLPENLSNRLCSLRPHEEKLTFSAVFELDKDYKIRDRWFGRTVIYSDRRFTYEEAQTEIESGEGDYPEELRELNKIAKHYRAKRFKEGSIDFDADEVRFELDENGKPISVYTKSRKDAHKLVEEFMLLANKEVATYLMKKGSEQQPVPAVYRIHDEPDMAKIADFSNFALNMGYRMEVQTPNQIAAAFNALSKAAHKDENLKILEPLAIRTMAKAVYSTDNIGHYGLGFDNYTHFTSPIRRYADVLVHRILFDNIGRKTKRYDAEALETTCKHISNQERKAVTAERESIKYKQVEFMAEHIGEDFDGIISGMIERGVFVELKDNKCEGFIGFHKFPESYRLDESRLFAVGNQSNHKLKMGDTIRVKITAADLEERKIDMDLVSLEVG